MTARGWTCRRVAQSEVCGHRNPPRTRKCGACGKPRAARRRPAHLRALDEFEYADFVELNGGNRCGICGRPPSWHRRLDRDHDHRSGTPRGLLCVRCNRGLPNWVTAVWLRAAADYLDRAEKAST